MRGRRLAKRVGRQRRGERGEPDLIEQHLDRVGAPERRRLDDDRRRAPQDRGQQRQRVAGQSAALRAAEKAAGDAEEGEQEPRPLDRPQPLVLEQECGPQRDDEGRGVDEDGRPRRGGEAQQFVERDELRREQRAGQRPCGLRPVEGENAPMARERVGDHTDRADAGADSRLSDRPDLRQGQLNDHLIEAPYDAERRDERGTERIEGFRLHGFPSPVGSAKARAAGLSLDPPPSSAARGINCASPIPRWSA